MKRQLEAHPNAPLKRSARANQKGSRWQDGDGAPRVHLHQVRVAGDDHLGTYRQRQGKKFIVFWVAALAHKLCHEESITVLRVLHHARDVHQFGFDQ